MFRTRLTLTQLEQRETPSDISPPVDPPTLPDNSPPAQTQPPSQNGPLDPHGS